MVKGLGVRGMYQGTFATLSRDIPFSLIFFPLYANLKRAFADGKGENRCVAVHVAAWVLLATWQAPPARIQTHQPLVSHRMWLLGFCFPRKHPPPIQTHQPHNHQTPPHSIGSLLGAGGIAGALGAWAATPADVVKTRLQVIDSYTCDTSVHVCVRCHPRRLKILDTSI